MSLDGLRAWIGEVERKLGKRTRVFLALCVIAIGIAGAAIYLALDARSDSVSEGDVQELQQELEAGGVGTGGSAALSQLETEVEALQAEVDRLKGNGGSGQGSGNDGGNKSGGSGSSSGGESGGGGASGGSGNSSGGGAIPAPSSPNGADLQKLLEEAKKQSEENE